MSFATTGSSYIGSGDTASTVTISGFTTSGTDFTFNDTSEPTRNNKLKRIGPKLYFRYVKSKLKKVEQKRLEERLSKLSVLIEEAFDCGQYAMHEELSRMLLELTKESELSACGINQFIDVKYIKKFKDIVREDETLSEWGKIVYFKKLEEFPRPIPKKIQTKIKQAKEKELFEEMWVLYLDYTEDSDNIKSTKEKIREKDPILFGSFNGDSKYYFIADWVDEVCDLTLDLLVEDYELDKDLKTIPTIDKKYITKLKKKLEKQTKALKETKQSNYKGLMKSEDDVYKSKKSWWKRLWGKK